ncbi:hypothetical protein IW262DRAFT_1486440 [Armillaria fumosa]|nr:hypothetical protein IW262DRAFT_1486440 [Armillaria fumosa]
MLSTTSWALLRLSLLHIDSGSQQVARSLKMLLIVFFCLQFSISHGFRFDDFSGTVTVGIPITLSWHRDVNSDTGRINFRLHVIKAQGNFQGPLLPDGTLNVTFPAPGEYIIDVQNQTANLGTSQTFDVAIGNEGSSTVPSSSNTVPTASALSTSTPFVSQSTEPSGSVFAHNDIWDCRSTSFSPQFLHGITTKHCNYPAVGLDSYMVIVNQFQTYRRTRRTNESGQNTATVPSNQSFTEPVQNTATAPSKSHSTHQHRETLIVIGAVIGSLVSLLLIWCEGTYFCIRRRKHQNQRMKYRLSPNPKVNAELNSHSPPVRNKNRVTITHTLAGGVAPNVGGMSQEPVEEITEGNPIRDTAERRNGIGVPLRVDISEPQGAPHQEGPRASLSDVVAEVLRLRTQFQQFVVEREVERVQGNTLDPPPAYA